MSLFRLLRLRYLEIDVGNIKSHISEKHHCYDPDTTFSTLKGIYQKLGPTLKSKICRISFCLRFTEFICALDFLSYALEGLQLLFHF